MRPLMLPAILCALLLCVIGCHPTSPPGTSGAHASVSVANRTQAPTTVYVSFAADSQVRSFDFCAPVGSSPCSFPLAASATQVLPSTTYLNVTMAFGAAPSCGQTEAEVTVNTPSPGQDTADVSLVNGYSNRVEIDVFDVAVTLDSGITHLGPPSGATGNETVYGLFPNGCDICVARQKPPCPGQSPCGSSPNDGGQGCGCKTGGQYDPAVPCQYGGPHDQTYVVALVP